MGKIMEINNLMVIIYASDMKNSYEFYHSKLGLEPVREDFNNYWNMFKVGDSHIALHYGGGQVGSNAPAVSLVVKDLKQARIECNDRGCGFNEVENPQPGVYFCHTKDPDDNVVYLHA